MPDGLSCRSLRCILEYLEVNKRLHITSRSLDLRKFEKQIPLHLDHLCLNQNVIRLNNITHEITPHGQYNCTVTMGKQSTVPWQGMDPKDAIKAMMFYFLIGREYIYVNHLELYMRKEWGSQVLPSNLQLKVRKLDTGLLTFGNAFLDVIHPTSFPLMELITEVRNVDDLSHDGLKTAKVLRISLGHPENEGWFIPSVASLKNTSIVIEGMARDRDEVGYFGVVRSYLQVLRSIGASLIMRGISKWEVSLLLDALKVELNWTEVNIKRAVERLSYHTPCSIPINPITAALIYGIYYSASESLFDVKVEIVSTDLVFPVVVRRDG